MVALEVDGRVGGAKEKCSSGCVSKLVRLLLEEIEHLVVVIVVVVEDVGVSWELVGVRDEASVRKNGSGRVL